jgi:acyl dehydratase
MKRSFKRIADLRPLVGSEIAVSDWIAVTQSRIDAFADVTDDRQWIHVDAKRAARELPEGRTIAHGFLIVSLFAPFFDRTVTVEERTSAINYGFNRLRFTDAVPCGSRLRARLMLQQYDDLTAGAQLTWAVTVEREGAEKPACVAEWITRIYGQPP